MKAKLDAFGQLTIYAENDLEQYALRKWWNDWQSKSATLHVAVMSETDPNTTHFKSVTRD